MRHGPCPVEEETPPFTIFSDSYPGSCVSHEFVPSSKSLDEFVVTVHLFNHMRKTFR